MLKSVFRILMLICLGLSIGPVFSAFAQQPPNIAVLPINTTMATENKLEDRQQELRFALTITKLDWEPRTPAIGGR